MSEITFEFAMRDDCLDKMVPSDLRSLVSERDSLRHRNKELRAMLREITACAEEQSEWMLKSVVSRSKEILLLNQEIRHD